MDLEQFRKHAHETVDFICDYYKNIEQYPVQSQVKPGEIANKLPQYAPEEGESFETIMKDLKEIVVPGLTHWQHPQFYAFFPANGSFPGIIGDMLSTGFGVQGMLWITSPACTELETVVLDWFAHALNLPQKFYNRNGTGGGVIQGTASEAALVCLVSARNRAVKRILSDPNNKLTEDEIKSKLTVYASDQTHSSIKKACMIAGISFSNFKVISTLETNLALTSQKFEETIAQDRKNGFIPIFVCSTVGTTGTTAVDDLTGIGKICQQENIWMHIDAAYAGSACICEEYQPLINGIEFAYSFNFNPHKWLLVNFDCSCLWVADRNNLVDSLSVIPEYLRNKATETGSVIDYRDWQVPLGRRFRSLKIWFVLRTYGLKGLKEHIRKHVAMAKEFEEWVKTDTRFEITAPRNLALVCFKLKASNDKNKLLEDRLNEKGQIYLTHTVMKDSYILRMSIGGTHTKEDHVKQAWEWIQEEAEKVLQEPEPSAQK